LCLALPHQVVALFDEWARLTEENPAEKVHANYIAQLQQAGFLKVRFSSSWHHSEGLDSCQLRDDPSARLRAPAAFCFGSRCSICFV
jgi:hypothetical protein